ncbi:MAG TPA: alkaline phosphatase family protein [Candidatus Angelobacter sp.]
MATLPFDHLVVLMMENRSFDHMLGFLHSPTYPIEGFDPNNLPNCDSVTGTAPVSVTADAKTAGDLEPDPAHDFVNVNVQIFGNKDGTVSEPLMRGFVKDYAAVSANVNKASNIMKCFTPQTLPVLSTLAKQYAICDHWYSSVPGSTIPNRLFTHAANCGGSLTQDAVLATLRLKTIFEIMDDPNNPFSYRIYTGSIGGTVLLSNLYLIHHQDGFHPYSQFRSDCAHGDLPAYTFIEPRYDDDLNNGLFANSQHPDFPVDEGEALIAEVYSALSNSPVWPRSLLLIVYDEHGGIFDHVAPPTLAPDPGFPPVPASTNPAFTFDRLGLRVPAVFISPLIKPGTIITNQFDHCSIVATVRKLFCLDKNPFNWREATASTFDNILNLSSANLRKDKVILPPPFISAGVAVRPQVRTPSDLTMLMAKSMQAAADTLGIGLKTHASEIYSAQDAINFLADTAEQFESRG